MQPKTPENSKAIQTDLVLPGDTNSLNSLFGGELLARMDRVASIAAIKHSEQIVVTASVNNVAFGEPVPVGSILTIEAKVSRAFNSSMEVFIDVWKQNKTNPKKTKVNEAIFTFVALGSFLAGTLHSNLGWETMMIYAIIPLVILLTSIMLIRPKELKST